MAIKILPNGFRCGCRPSPVRQLLRRPNLGYYLRNVPPGPAVCQRTTGYSNWGMKLNDQLGCCVVSGWVHMKQAQSFVDAEGPVHDIPDSEVRRIYLQHSPGDNGLVIDDWLDWCERQPMPWAGGPHGIIDPEDREALKKAVWWLGGLVLGIGVPDQWGRDIRNGFVWDRVGRFEGVCHDVQAVDYNERGLEIITWGVRGTITWAGMAEQCGETHAVLAPDWYGDDQRSPPGLDRAALHSYLTEITGGPPAPPIDPPVPPGPTPPPIDPPVPPGPTPPPIDPPVPPGPTPPPIDPPVPPGPTPPPAPNPSCAEYVRRALAVCRQGAEILQKDPADTRVKVALDWLEGWLR